MKTRFALTLMVLLPLLAACKANDGSADVTDAPQSETATAPAADPAATPAADTGTEDTNAPSPEASAAAAGEQPADAGDAHQPPVAPNNRPTGPEPVAGTDYVVIEGGRPYQPAAGKIEVAEVFGYVCPACFALQPLLAPWKAGLPSDVNFVYVPAMFGGPWDTYARAFYAAQTLGVQEKTHQALYNAIHVDKTLMGERGMDSPESIAEFYAKHAGVDKQKFIDTMGSFGVAAKTNRAKQFAIQSKITGTPSLIVAGKYLVKGKSFADMLRIADFLVARERSAMSQQKTEQQ